MAGTSGADASAHGRDWVVGPTSPPEQRQSADAGGGAEQLGEDERLLIGTDLADNERARFTVLERQTCFNLMSTRDIGRVAFTIEGDAAPTVLPVNYTLLNDTVIFRSTLAGTIMRYARGYAAFQVDHFDDERREGGACWPPDAAGGSVTAESWNASPRAGCPSPGWRARATRF